VFDEAGAVLGITIAESPRRGRVITTAADTLVRELGLAGVAVTGAPVAELGETGTSAVGRELRGDNRVMRVVCFAG
jgi:serine protease Do